VGVRAAALHVAGGTVTRVVMDHAAPEFGAVADAAQVTRLARGLGLTPDAITETGWPVQVVSTGIRQLFIPVRSLAEVRNLSTRRQDTGVLAEICVALDPETHCNGCLMVFTTEAEQADLHTRMFAPGQGIAEDPATGSATGGLAAYVIENGVFPATPPTTHLTSEQGIEMGRPSRLTLEIDGAPCAIAMVRVGGAVVPVIEGVLRF
jgi:trans-2,3-dihydro-3-hydroxyanthranilate isomerase